MINIQKLKEFIKSKILWIILGMVLIFLIMIIEDLWDNELVNFDNVIYSFIKSWHFDFLTVLMKIISNLGSALTLIGICLLTLFIFNNKKVFYIMSSNLLVIYLFNVVLKIFFVRSRPEILHLVHESGYSFPSGHAMVSTAFYGLIIYLIVKNMKNKTLKIVSISFLTFLIIMICISRIYLGVHYASDVIAGICVAIIYLIFLIKILKINSIKIIKKGLK